MSVWQTPQATSRTSTSPAFGSASSTSCTASGCPNSSSTAARICIRCLLVWRQRRDSVPGMRAFFASRTDADDPLSALEVGERPDPQPPDGWTTVAVKAASLNHHDLWSLRGVGLGDDRLPMILGCDAAGVDEDGNEVIVHSVIASDGWRGDETLDPKRTLLSELHPGAL